MQLFFLRRLVYHTLVDLGVNIRQTVDYQIDNANVKRAGDMDMDRLYTLTQPSAS